MRFFKLYLLASLLCCVASIANAQKPVELKPTPPAPIDNSPAQAEKNKADAQLLLDIFVTEQHAQLYAMDSVAYKTYSDAATQLVDLYAKAVKQPGVLRVLVGKPLGTFLQIKESARGAAQVSQGADELAARVNVILVAQNQRIIELLEQIAKKR